MRTALLMLLLVSAAYGEGTTRAVPANSWVEIDVEGPCLLQSEQVEVRTYARVAEQQDGDTELKIAGFVGVFWSGNHDEIIVKEWRNGAVIPIPKTHIILVRGPPGPTPDPDPIDPIDDDDPPVDPDLPETQYGVGPAVALAFRNVPEPHREACKAAFAKASTDANRVAKPLKQIEADLQGTITKLSSQTRAVVKPYNEVYLVKFREAMAAGTVSDLRDYSAYWKEIVDWWDTE